VRVPVGDGAVKESVPVAEKNPLMESACATAALLTAKAAASTARRLSMGNLRGWWNSRKNFLALSIRRCPVNLLRLAGAKKITHYSSANKAKIVATTGANFCLTKSGSDFVSSGVPNSPPPQILPCGQTKSFW
jgi:hypothetical protein